MIYANIISDMVWSYSRITSFEDCPYRFLLSYIRKTPKTNQFFSDYGSFIHRIIEMCLNGMLGKDELYSYYLANFKTFVPKKAYSQKVFDNYFSQGAAYLKNFEFPHKNVLAVEQEYEFEVNGLKFVGVVDCTAENNSDLIILDNKSRTLKPRSQRSKPLKSDIELDEYLRQLYLYAIPIREKYGKYPKRLQFNCFRSGQLIDEPFDPDVFEKTKQWVEDSVEKITNNENWDPIIEPFKCRYICDQYKNCVYFQKYGGDK